ncbi:MAG: pilus assembly protein FimV, partial [Janthinobacterium sp.]
MLESLCVPQSTNWRQTMPVNTRFGIASFALKKCAIAVACGVILSASAHAAGLGKITVLSALGQPLKAEIELTSVASDDTASMAVKLAPAEVFRQANIEFNPALLSIRFAIEQRSNRKIIAVTSSQPINEPFVDILLELSWSSGRLVREYTFLLDPPEMLLNQPVPVTEPVPSAPAAAPARTAGRDARPSDPALAGTARRAPEVATQYRVQPGDTLFSIASKAKPVDVSLDQMLVALYRSNESAFTENNMNRMQSGKILTLPDATAISAASRNEARGVVIAHAADFSAYRNNLARQVASDAAANAPEASQSATGKISAKVEERATPANASQDQLKLSKSVAGQDAVADAGKAQGLEDLVAKDQKIADATARVKELEKNVRDLERLVAAKTLQELTDRAAVAPVAAPAAESVPKVTAPVPIKPPLAIKQEVPAPSLLDMVFDNILSIGLALAALLLLGLLALRRNKPSAKAAAAIPADSSADSGAATTDSEDIDESNNSVFNSTFSSTSGQIDIDEVDPVAEADVYLAYGREAQAEEILWEALRTYPERYPVRLKLLEIYAGRKDVDAFAVSAAQLHAVTN